MATNGRLVSLDTIIERVYRKNKFNYSLSYSEAAEWAGSIIATMGSRDMLTQACMLIKIRDYKGKLPCDMESIIQTMGLSRNLNDCFNGVIATAGHGSFYVNVTPEQVNIAEHLQTVQREIEVGNCQCSIPIGFVNQIFRGSDLYPMVYTGDNFHLYHSAEQSFVNSGIPGDNGYIVQGNSIFTKIKHGYVLMSYLAIPTDSKGLPMIPADETVQMAVEWEIARNVAYVLWMSDKLSRDKFQYVDQQRDWYVKQAINESKMPTVDEFQTFLNDRVRLIPKLNHHESGFRNMQIPEQMINHPIRWTV